MTIDVKRHTLFARFRNTMVATSLLALAACGNGTHSNNNGETVLPDEATQEAVVETPTGDDSQKAADDITVEATSTSDRAAILSKYAYLDPKHVVPAKALEDAVIYWNQNKVKFPNVNYISVINFGQSSKEARFYIVDMHSGSVWAIHTAHGKGSDANHDGYAEKFSNVSGSQASSLGYYKAAETYIGSHGLSLKLDGLSSTNSNARARSVVIHAADYVQESSVIQGRSWGCPAIAPQFRNTVVNSLKNGSLIYATVDKGGKDRDWSSGIVTTPTPTPTPPVVTPPTNPGTYNMVPLAWESSKYPQREVWSDYLMTLVLTDWKSLLAGANDMKTFCPKYSTLNNNQRANVWAQLFVSMAKYESAYSPTSRMQETTMGTDPVTGRPVYSEGLLQLSYQDVQGFKFCKLNWSKDKNLSSTDPKKTILDPYINLHCAVGIMANQIAKKGSIAIGSGAYWAVIKTNSKYNQLSSITSMVKNFALCR